MLWGCSGSKLILRSNHVLHFFKRKRCIKISGFERFGTLTAPWTRYRRDAEMPDIDGLIRWIILNKSFFSIAAQTISRDIWALTFTSHWRSPHFRHDLSDETWIFYSSLSEKTIRAVNVLVHDLDHEIFIRKIKDQIARGSGEDGSRARCWRLQTLLNFDLLVCIVIVRSKAFIKRHGSKRLATRVPILFVARSMRVRKGICQWRISKENNDPTTVWGRWVSLCTWSRHLVGVTLLRMAPSRKWKKRRDKCEGGWNRDREEKDAYNVDSVG